MEILAAIVAIVIGLVGLDLAALRWGTDSRRWDRDTAADSFLDGSHHV